MTGSMKPTLGLGVDCLGHTGMSLSNGMECNSHEAQRLRSCYDVDLLQSNVHVVSTVMHVQT